MSEDDFMEERYWSWECPKCGQFNDLHEDPHYIEGVCCEECKSEFNVD